MSNHIWRKKNRTLGASPDNIAEDAVKNALQVPSRSPRAIFAGSRLLDTRGHVEDGKIGHPGRSRSACGFTLDG